MKSGRVYTRDCHLLAVARSYSSTVTMTITLCCYHSHRELDMDVFNVLQAELNISAAAANVDNTQVISCTAYCTA